MEKNNSKFCVKGLCASGMVLQRETVNCISGSCEKEASVKMIFRGKTYEAEIIEVKKGSRTKVEEDSNWKIEFNPGTAGGPFELEIHCNEEKLIFTDVYVGEVWLSSGQSNAQLPMERLKYSYTDEFFLPENPFIRMITIPISYAFGSEKDTVENPVWKCANPENLGELSGTAYFFAKELQKKLGVPVGIINASQGGSPIYAWMNSVSLGGQSYSAGYFERIKQWKKKSAIKSKKEEVAEAQKKWDSAIFELDKGIGGQWEKLSFEECEKITQKKWNNFNIPGDFDLLGKKAGVVWFKKQFELSAEQAALLNDEKLTTMIWFGTIQDADKIWINNQFCGATYYTYPPRRYKVLPGAFKEGLNTVTVRVQKNGSGPIRFFEEKPYYIFGDKENAATLPKLLVKKHPPVVASRNMEQDLQKIQEQTPEVLIPLDGQWKYCISCETEPRPEEMFFEWEPTALYNGMLAPCFNHSIAGVLWYQGESNADESQNYEGLLLKMMALWRKKFVYASKKSAFPFVVMGLPNWAEGYKEENNQHFGDWPGMRYAQFRATEIAKNSAFVSMIDGGEWNDLHPEKKQTGGTRAAKEALRIAYGFDKSSGFNPAPKVEYCESKDNVFTVRFNCGSAELKAYSFSTEEELWKRRVDFSKECTEVCGFEFLTAEGRLIPAKAKLISKTDVEIYLPEIVESNEKIQRNLRGELVNKDAFVELRLLWKNNPWVVNLYSSEGTPVIPFKIGL
ncbi:MAG: hypothetical protein MJ188_09725 [Treponema sp.]|nr:hypothetical protein [Treponema sp.]